MHMIRRAVDRPRWTFQFACDPTHISVQIGTPIVVDQRKTFSCTEDDVHEQIGIGVRHGVLSALTGLGNYCRFVYPGLAPRATFLSPLAGL